MIYLIACLISLNLANCDRFTRLVMPENPTELKIIPKVEMPMAMTTSVNSGMNMQFPITVRFPSIAEVTDPVRTVANSPANIVDLMSKLLSTLTQTDKLLNTTTMVKARMNSKAGFFRTIEESTLRLGSSCLHRAICEVAEVPFMSPSMGLIGEVVDLLFK